MNPHTDYMKTVKRYYGIQLTCGGVVSTYHHTGPKPLSIGTSVQVECDICPLDAKIVSRIFSKPEFETKSAILKTKPRE